MQQAYNTTQGPIVVDDEGHILGGGERGPADPDVVHGDVEAGRLLWVDAIPDPVSADDKSEHPAGVAAAEPDEADESPSRSTTSRARKAAANRE